MKRLYNACRTHKKICIFCAVAAAVLLLAGAVFWYLQFADRDSSLPFPGTPRPAVEEAYASAAQAQAAGGGWYVVMEEEFAGSELPAPWTPSPHGLRNTEYWCDQMVDTGEDGLVKIYAMELSDHVCDICPAAGDFTSGIETRRMVDGGQELLFEQAFGYFEARVYLPRGPGMWSAFWLQTESMRQVGSRGRDGSEIDIYESAFYFSPTSVGNAVIWDGYDFFYRVKDHIADTGINQYDGWHTYGLLWSPESYTFFADGKAIWETNAGGVSQVPGFLRLTAEIRRSQTGPHGAKLGDFANTRENPSVFEIDYVKVYQHTDFR